MQINSFVLFLGNLEGTVMKKYFAVALWEKYLNRKSWPYRWIHHCQWQKALGLCLMYLLKMKPTHFKRQLLTTEKRVYNYHLSRARRVVFNTFGILSNQWRVYRWVMAGKPRKAEEIVKFCAFCMISLGFRVTNTNNLALIAEWLTDWHIVQLHLWRPEFESRVWGPLPILFPTPSHAFLSFSTVLSAKSMKNARKERTT